MLESLAAEMEIDYSSHTILSNIIKSQKSFSQQNLSSSLNSLSMVSEELADQKEQLSRIGESTSSISRYFGEMSTLVDPAIFDELLKTQHPYQDGLSKAQYSYLDADGPILPPNSSPSTSTPISLSYEEFVGVGTDNDAVVLCDRCSNRVLAENAQNYIDSDGELLCPHCATSDRHIQ